MDGKCPLLRINLGCGRSPTFGYINFDNSLSVILSKIPFVSDLLRKLSVINEEQYSFITFARKHEIKYADVRRTLPISHASVDVVYASHLLEHLDRVEARFFLDEVKRVLRPGGTLRLVVPDLRRQAQKYLQDGDADEFIRTTALTQSRPRRLSDRLKAVILGGRHHKYMYDSISLSRLLESCAFHDVTVLKPGDTTIIDAGDLQLKEREDESIYIEAVKF